jgi:hypothetical protein
MKIIGILQPSYLPWLGYFDQIARSEVFVFYDDVQYDKNGWRNRNRIKTANGVQWLTVPVLLKGKEFPLINEVEIDNSQKWVKKHVTAIEQNYKKCKYYDDFICEILKDHQWTYLCELNCWLIDSICKFMGLEESKLSFSSCFKKSEDTIQKLINIVKEFYGTHFIEGAAGRNYMDENVINQFKQNDIEVIFQDYQHPVYEQRFGEFVSHLSILDVLFNCGKEKTRMLLCDKC